MEVYLSIRAVIADYTCDVPELEMYVYGTLEDARNGQVVLELEPEKLPRYGVYFDYPTTPRKFEKWLEKNKNWANRVAPYIGHPGF